MDIGIFIAIFAISGGLGVAVYAIWLDGKKRQLRHIERMAMIEKGITPPAVAENIMEGRTTHPAVRRGQRSAGVFMICLGIGLSFMFYDYQEGVKSIWIGAFIAMIGLANVVNALFDERDAYRSRPSSHP